MSPIRRKLIELTAAVVLIGASGTAFGVVITDLIGDKDCFGLGGVLCRR